MNSGSRVLDVGRVSGGGELAGVKAGLWVVDKEDLGGKKEPGGSIVTTTDGPTAPSGVGSSVASGVDRVVIEEVKNVVEAVDDTVFCVGSVGPVKFCITPGDIMFISGDIDSSVVFCALVEIVVVSVKMAFVVFPPSTGSAVVIMSVVSPPGNLVV